MFFVGVDVSATRGFDLAVLDDERRLSSLWHAASLADIRAGLDDLDAPFVVAIDAPWRLSAFPLRDPLVRAKLAVPPPEGRYNRYRVCDYELARRGIPLYLLPEPGGPTPSWMQAGFDLFATLERVYGLRTPEGPNDTTASLLEVYPFASFVCLLGGRPPRKTTGQGAAARSAALETTGITGLPDRSLSHDALDAVAAAYTGWAWRHGAGGAVGLPDEGLIVLPIPALKDRYTALPDAPLFIERSSDFVLHKKPQKLRGQRLVECSLPQGKAGDGSQGYDHYVP